MAGPRLKKGDIVIVRKGKDKGKTGKVLMIFPEKDRVLVEKVHFVKEFIKPDRSKNVSGGIMEKESPLAVANVMLYCGECEEGVRVRTKVLDDGSRVRVCHKCGLTLEKQK